MSRQGRLTRSITRQRGFSSASDVCGVERRGAYKASPCSPVGRCEVGDYSSKSTCILGGMRRFPRGTGYLSEGYGAGGRRGAGYCGRRGDGTVQGHGTLGGYAACERDGIQRVCINKSLLTPLCVGVDPQEHQVRSQEKEQMKCLNNQFACFIDKVQCLEQQNKVLETKWNLLQQHTMPAARKTLAAYFENYLCKLKKQLECLLGEREQLSNKECAAKKLVDEFRCKYEEVINKRMDAEQGFVLAKKDVDYAFLNMKEQEVKVDLLKSQLELLNHVFTEERAQMDCQLCDTSVMVKMDNRRDLDMENIIKNVECCYKEIAQKSKEEVDTLYQTRVQELQEQRGRFCDDLESNKREIAQLTQLIQELQCELDNVKKQIGCLQTDIRDAEQSGDVTLQHGQAKHVELQNALQKSKEELASMLRDYQELLNVKLALDIEITTYKTLLEGEESRICSGTPVTVAVVTSSCDIAEHFESAARIGGPRRGRSSRSTGGQPRRRASSVVRPRVQEGVDCFPTAGLSSRSDGFSSQSWGYQSRTMASTAGGPGFPGGVACCPKGGPVPKKGEVSSHISACQPGSTANFGPGGCVVRHLGSSPIAGEACLGVGGCDTGVVKP